MEDDGYRGDERLAALFDEFRAQLVSPGGAAQLLGVTRQTIYTLGQRGHLRVFRSTDLGGGGDSEREVAGSGSRSRAPAWVYIPVADVYAYAERVGRPIPRRGWS
jgi:hypothetical protein